MIGSRTVVNEPKLGNQNFIYYGDDLAEEGCTQVAIVTLDEVEAESSNQGGNGQFNFKDNHTDYEYHSCLTRYKDYNYACYSTLKRELYTQEAFNTLRKWNPIQTSDWGSSYMPFVEEVMNVTASVYQLMYKHLAGDATMYDSAY